MAKKTTSSKPIAALKPPAKPKVISKAPIAKLVSARPVPVNTPAPKPTAPAKPIAPASKAPGFTLDDIALRAYFIAEKRCASGAHGDEHQDWVEAERQLLAESKAKRKPKRG